jgi:hypothetical protein
LAFLLNAAKSKMISSKDFKGQWIGYFTYGPAYGDELNGEKVQFRLFVNACSNMEFSGKSIDLEGIGANYEVAEVKGFLKEDFISFTKQYPHYHEIDETGNTLTDQNSQHPEIQYEGYYDSHSKKITGIWEMSFDLQQVGENWLEHVCSGTWEIKKDD